MDISKRKKLTTNIGLKRELEASACFHQNSCPLLIDPTLLRSFGLGQIDLAFFKENKLIIAEVKGKVDPSQRQYMRIYRSAHWLGDLFKCSVQVETYMASLSTSKLNRDKNNARQEEQRFLT